MGLCRRRDVRRVRRGAGALACLRGATVPCETICSCCCQPCSHFQVAVRAEVEATAMKEVIWAGLSWTPGTFEATSPASQPATIAKTGPSSATNRPISEPSVLARGSAGLAGACEGVGKLVTALPPCVRSLRRAGRRLLLPDDEAQAHLGLQGGVGCVERHRPGLVTDHPVDADVAPRLEGLHGCLGARAEVTVDTGGGDPALARTVGEHGLQLPHDGAG